MYSKLCVYVFFNSIFFPFVLEIKVVKMWLRSFLVRIVGQRGSM